MALAAGVEGAAAQPANMRSLWRAAVARSRAAVDRASEVDERARTARKIGGRLYLSKKISILPHQSEYLFQLYIRTDQMKENRQDLRILQLFHKMYELRLCNSGHILVSYVLYICVCMCI